MIDKHSASGNGTGQKTQKDRRKRIIRLLAIGSVSFGITIWGAVLLGWPAMQESVLTRTDVEVGKQSRQLVVILHAYMLGWSSLADLKREVKAVLPDADILIPQYDSSPFSDADILQIASHLEALIDETVQRRAANSGGRLQYERVILIGHSVGALLVRKAYLYGRGSTEDHPINRGPTHPHSWVRKVDRIILMAGMNRGLSLSPKPKNMKWYKYVISKLGILIGRLTGTGKLIRSVERGSPFVANLRVQWIRLAHKRGDPAPQ